MKRRKASNRNRVVVFDRETAEPLRYATKQEMGEHYQFATRDEKPLDGKHFGFPGRKVWLAQQDPRGAIIGWDKKNHPIYKGWVYSGWEFREGEEDRKVAFSDKEALAFAKARKGRDGLVDGKDYGAPGARVRVDYTEDLGLAPAPMLKAWRRAYWTPTGKPKTNPAAAPPQAA